LIPPSATALPPFPPGPSGHFPFCALGATLAERFTCCVRPRFSLFSRGREPHLDLKLFTMKGHYTIPTKIPLPPYLPSITPCVLVTTSLPRADSFSTPLQSTFPFRQCPRSFFFYRLDLLFATFRCEALIGPSSCFCPPLTSLRGLRYNGGTLLSLLLPPVSFSMRPYDRFFPCTVRFRGRLCSRPPFKIPAVMHVSP